MMAAVILAMFAGTAAAAPAVVEVPEQLLGPYALLVATLIVVAVLWRDHAKNDQRREDQLLKSTETIADFAEAIRGNTAIIEDALVEKPPRARR